ncbi:MAG: LysM peptidoglycan-binding domain-containing protein [Bacteroidia bacterium]|nr:LysM peptidoglycan-binding domain-containing protein [Bacteroidia bacterium]
MKLKTIKYYTLHLVYILCTLYFVLNTTQSYSQEKPSGGILKSKNVTTINGVKYYLHTVEKGQTLFAIAKGYELSLNDIVIENPEAIDGIKPGQVLKVPTKKAKKIESAPITNGGNYVLHQVEAGQTLYSISKQYNTTVEKIKILNPELKEGLKGGQTLKISLLKPKSGPEILPKSTIITTEKPIKKPTEKVLEKKVAQTDPILMGPVDSSTTFLIENRDLDTIAASTISYKGEVKDEYNIAFFLPFHANEANEIDIEAIIKGDAQLPNKSSIALQFYEGALLAIDSLKKQKLNAKIFVYDIDDQDSLNILNILKKPELKEMHLMIGPLYGSSFMPVAKFAKDHSIPIVSPFTQINKVLFDNLYVCKVLPSNAMQVEQMAHFVIDTFQKQNIILVNNGNPKEVSFYNVFKNIANKALIKAGYKAADSLKEVRSSASIENMLSSSKLNVIVLPSNNQSYVTEFISKLNPLADKYKIVLLGLQSWINYDNLDFDYLNKLSVHIPSNNYIDYQNPVTRNFINTFYERFKTDPELYSYQGYDIAYYFISALQKYGTGFLNNIVDYKYQGIETNFNFMQYPLDSGFENKFVYILKYQDNKLVKAN